MRKAMAEPRTWGTTKSQYNENCTQELQLFGHSLVKFHMHVHTYIPVVPSCRVLASARDMAPPT